MIKVKNKAQIVEKAEWIGGEKNESKTRWNENDQTDKK